MADFESATTGKTALQGTKEALEKNAAGKGRERNGNETGKRERKRKRERERERERTGEIRATPIVT